MAANRRMKAPLSSLQSLRPFYTGGTVSVTPDEEGLICVCGEELKVQAHSCKWQGVTAFHGMYV